ncbi:MAG TPA: cold shock domain-containing protein [Streptosporangiaceae bacterium]
MATGRVLQYDDTRGFGFIAADDGGEDVFLHASVFDGEPSQLTPGTRVEFEVMAGDRGRKAYAAHVLRDTPASAEQHAPDPAAGPESAPADPADEAMCDVLSPSEFGHEVTELLFEAVPDLTGRQILQLRQSLLELAQKRGWVDT